jgi:hypothetical protein
MINFQKAFKFSKAFFTALGKNVTKAHKRSIFTKGLDHAGTTFKDYTPAYKKQKQALGKYTGKADLTLSGNMKNAFQFIDADKTGFSYGIEGDESKKGSMAERMDFQGDQKKPRRDGINAKRFTTTKTNPTPPAEQQMIGKEMAKQVVKSFTKELRKNGMGYKVYTI